MIDSNVTGMANAARKTPITASLHSHETNDGRNARVMYSFGRERITPPCFAWSHSFLSLRHAIRPTITTSRTTPTPIAIEATGCAERLPRFSLNEPGTERKR